MKYKSVGSANQPTGPFGFFQTGPHRTVREVIEEYRDELVLWLWEWRRRR